MILDIDKIQKYIIIIVKKFKELVSEFDIEIINTYNHPYMSQLTVKKQNVLVIKFDNVEGLFTHNSRTGAFYDNVNEFSIFFMLYFINFINNESERITYSRNMKLYELFSDFLHDSQSHKFTIDSSDEYNILLNIFIYNVSNLNQSGFVKLNSNHNNLAYCSSCTFKTNLQIIEKLKET
ncbi:DUF764 family protein [Borrelia hispanica]|uniref:DUF764 family protein n=1 Tax=Borrelia hispanica TaxID=40835 RepID=UPI0004647397|nr:DUF764 family protein [Borrelia hispanica]